MSQRLVIARQTSLSSEKVNKDGKTKNVHFVLKDKPFIVDVHLVNDGNSKDNNNSIELKSLILEANLLYDNPEKEVNFINVKPFEYMAKLNPEGTGFILECFIKILSSQNENALFKIRIKTSRKGIIPLEVLTEPIQVISKPSVLRKKQERETQKLAKSNQRPVKKLKVDKEDLIPSSSPTSPVLVTTTNCTKRLRDNDQSVLDALAILTKQQEKQQKILETLLLNQRRYCGNGCIDDGNTTYDHQGSPRTPYQQPHDTSYEFDIAFKNLIMAFNSLPNEDRPCKIRKVLADNEEPAMSTLIDCMWTENWNIRENKPLSWTTDIDMKVVHPNDFNELFTGFDNIVTD